MQTYSYPIAGKQTFDTLVSIFQLHQWVNILPPSSSLRSFPNHSRRILFAARKSICNILVSLQFLRHTKIMSQYFPHWLLEISDGGIFISYTLDIIRSVVITSSVIILIISSVSSRLFNHILLFVKKVKFFAF